MSIALRSSSALNDRELGEALTTLAASLSTPSSSSAGPSSSGASGASPGTPSRAGEDWQTRREALAQLQKFAEEDVSARPVFVHMLPACIKVPLVNQLADKRSAIVRAACDTIAAFARCSTNRTVWASMCAWLVPALMQLTASTTRAVADAGAETLRTMASQRGFGAEALGELLKCCRGRHPAVRGHALQTLLVLMRVSKGTTQQLQLSKFAAPVSRVIAAGIVDADEAVRKAARHCYWGLYAVEPKTASVLYDSLAPSVRALLERDKDDALRVVGTVEASDHTTARRGAAGASPSVSPRSSQQEGQRPHVFHSDEAALQDELQAVAAERARASSASARLRGSPVNTAAHGELILTEPALVPVPRTGSVRAVGAEEPGHETAPSLDSATAKEWKVLQDSLINTNWEMRLDAVQLLHRALRSQVERGGDPGMLASAVDELVRRLSDPHFRVCLAALECLEQLLSTRGTLAHFSEVARHDTLLALLIDTTSRKDTVKQRAAMCLVQVLAQLEPGVAVDELLQCLDDVATPLVRSRALEAIHVLIEYRCNAFTEESLTAPLLRALVRKLHGVETGTDGAGLRERELIWSPAVGAVRQLHERVPEALSAATRLLSGDDQVFVRRILSDTTGSTTSKLLHFLPADSPRGALTAIMDRPLPCAEKKSPARQHPASSSPRSAAKHATASPQKNGAADRETSASVQQNVNPQIVSNLVSPPSKDSRMPRSGRSLANAQHSPPPPRHPQHLQQGAGLFSSDFSPDRFLDPNEPRTAVFPYADTEGEDGGDGDWHRAGAPTGTLPSAAFMHGRRRSASVASDTPSPTKTMGRHTDDPTTTPRSPTSILQLLCGPSTTSDEVCSLLDVLGSSTPWIRDHWSNEDTLQLLQALLDRLCTEHAQPFHTVRRRSFVVLRSLMELPSMRPVVARHLSRILRVCRAGLDDAFFEVQQEASLVMHTALRGCGLPVDLCLNALAGVIEGWQRGPTREDATRGWLEVLSEVGRVLEQAHVSQTGKVRNTDPNVMMTEAVLRRVSRVVQWCAGHCAAEVRRTAILVLVSMWLTMDAKAFPFFVPLSASQRKLVSIYFNKALLLKRHAPKDKVDRLLKGVLQPASASRALKRSTVYRDLTAEMRAAGFPEPTTL